MQPSDVTNFIKINLPSYRRKLNSVSGPPGLTPDDKLAIHLYTIQGPFKFFDRVNSPLHDPNRSNENRDLQAAVPYSKLLIKALRKLDP